MHSTRLSASIKTAFAFFFVSCFTRVSASINTAFAFSLVWGHNACVSHACLHWLKRLFRFLWYCITMHAFQLRVFILRQLRIALQCMRFTRLSASIKTAFAFSLLWGHNAYVSHACLHILRQLLRFFCIVCFTCVSAFVTSSFSLVWRYNAHTRVCIWLLRCLWYGAKVHVFHTRLCIYKTAFAFSLAWGHNACVSHASLHLLRRLLRFTSHRITMHAFHTLVFIY